MNLGTNWGLTMDYQTVTNVVLILLAVIVGLFLLINILIIIIITRVLYEDKHHAHDAKPSDYDLIYEEINFNSYGDDVGLKGWFIPSNIKNRPAIILIHGHRSSMGVQGDIDYQVPARDNEEKLLGIAKTLHKENYNLFMLDMRNHGKSDDLKPFTFGIIETNDVLGAMKYLLSRTDIDSNMIALWGESLGAVTAIISAGLIQNNSDMSIRGVWSDSAFANFFTLLKNQLSLPYLSTLMAKLAVFWLTTLIKKKRADTDNYISNIEVPIYLVHAENDNIVRVENLYMLYNASNKDATQYWVENTGKVGDGHVDLQWSHTDEYNSRMIKFFQDIF